MKKIYDIGMHKGEDTDFYLKKGFEVIAIEANPTLCEYVESRFQPDIREGRLTVINKAISSNEGRLNFYVNDVASVWGTADVEWVKRNERRGAKSTKIEVDATTISKIMETYGCPYYMKIDIEGFDHLCLEQLANCTETPQYVSVESSATSFRDTLYQLELLRDLGYTKFKIIPQRHIFNQICPNPQQEGKYVDHEFPKGSSGLFGKELPGDWITFEQAKSYYKRIHFDCRMIGPNNGYFRNAPKRIMALLNKIFPNGLDWFDTHAKR